MTQAAPPTMSDIDLTDLDNFAEGFPHHIFQTHRNNAPVWWHEPTEFTPGGEGFWSVATYAETLEVLLDPVTYSSERGGDRVDGGTLIEDLPVAGLVLNMMDDPRHARIRRLVSRGLTPRMLRRIESDLRGRVIALLDAVEPTKPFDFVHDVSAELPMQMICVLLGVPEADRHWLFEAVEPGFDIQTSRTAAGPTRGSSEVQARMHSYGTELIAEKRRHPADDMLSIVANANLADEEEPELSDSELYMFFSLLFSAGSETTRNAIAGGLLALAEEPAQYRRLQKAPDILPTAIEEMVRWTTPSPAKRRTATRTCQLGGQAIAAGEKVVVWEGSANRDEQVFRQADSFDIARDPNPHLGFGRGIHFCLGANLARLETRVMFEELLARFDPPRIVEPVVWTRSNRHTGIRRLVVELSQAARPAR